MKLSVPIQKAANIGIRGISEKSVSEEVFTVLEQPKQPYVHDTNWNKRYNTNVEKIKTGDILEVAEVVRDLSHRHLERGLSIGEKKMLNTAKDILLSEMVLSQNLSHENLDAKIDDAIKFSFNEGKMNEGSNEESENTTTIL